MNFKLALREGGGVGGLQQSALPLTTQVVIRNIQNPVESMPAAPLPASRRGEISRYEVSRRCLLIKRRRVQRQVR